MFDPAVLGNFVVWGRQMGIKQFEMMFHGISGATPVMSFILVCWI